MRPKGFLLVVCLVSSIPLPLSAQDSGVVTVRGLLWTTSDRGEIVDWRGAATYCERSTLAERSDWRLPTSAELLTIYDSSAVDSSGKKLLQPFVDGVHSNWIWSADRADESNAFAMDFKTGSRTLLPADFAEGAHGLCVARAGSAPVAGTAGANTADAAPAATAARSSADASPRALGTPDPSEIVAAHNRWRAEVGAPALGWSDDLAASAAKWAARLKGKGCELVHSSGEYGENLYGASPITGSGGNRMQEISSTDVVDSWGSEKQWYDAASQRCSREPCGHYTQVVWAKTKEVGCAAATCRDLSQVWVCQYRPAGNSGGRPF